MQAVLYINEATRVAGGAFDTLADAAVEWCSKHAQNKNQEQELSFEECQKQTFNAVATHNVDGIAFYVALAQAWASLHE